MLPLHSVGLYSPLCGEADGLSSPVARAEPLKQTTDHKALCRAWCSIENKEDWVHLTVFVFTSDQKLICVRRSPSQQVSGLITANDVCLLSTDKKPFNPPTLQTGFYMGHTVPFQVIAHIWAHN